MRAIIAFISGFLIGLLGVLIGVAACVWDERMKWSAITEIKNLRYWIAVVVIGGMNGAIGAEISRRWNKQPYWPVTILPLALQLLPAFVFLLISSDSKTWGGYLLITIYFGIFVWIAGRTGQEIGGLCGGSSRHAGANQK